MAGSPSASGEAVWQVPEHARLDLLAALSTEPGRPARMSYEEFLTWANEDTLAEWVDGSVVMTSPASAAHQYRAIFLATLLSTYVRVHDRGAVLTRSIPDETRQSTR